MRWIHLLALSFLITCCSDPSECPVPEDGSGVRPGEDTRQLFDTSGPGLDTGSAEDTSSPGEDTTPLENHAPSLLNLPPVEVDMGRSLYLDLGPYMEDQEDGDQLLTLSWSGDHVAMQDSGDHRLLVVGPVNWWGIEVIPITVTDSGGLTDTGDLTITVNEVIPPETEPETPCGQMTFSFTPGFQAQEVLLAGTFNNWGNPPGAFEPMADPDGDGIWELTKIMGNGEWEYKFVADGNWYTDPTNPNMVSDGYGGYNSILVIPPCMGR